MDTTNKDAQPPQLGVTAMGVWKAWRGQSYQMGSACYAMAIDHSLGELTWQNDGLYRVDAVNPHLARRLTNTEEDRVWDALVAGRLRIYRRPNARAGIASSIAIVLHEATGQSIPDGM